jgi:hypothetical protein
MEKFRKNIRANIENTGFIFLASQLNFIPTFKAANIKYLLNVLFPDSKGTVNK